MIAAAAAQDRRDDHSPACFLFADEELAVIGRDLMLAIAKPDWFDK